jgi:hypothetical protein
MSKAYAPETVHIDFAQGGGAILEDVKRIKGE